MAIEIRPPAGGRASGCDEAAEVAFGSAGVEDDDWERERKALPASRALAAFDGGKPVALAGAYAFDLTIPGGELPCAGVTWVGVMPTHRRPGILRDLMSRQLEDVHGWGEPIAALWASEAAIYGRFGYGQAAPSLARRSPTPRASRCGRDGRAAPSGSSTPTRRSRSSARLRARPRRPGRDALARRALVEGASARRPGELAARRQQEVLRRRRGRRRGRGLRDYRVKDEWEDGFAKARCA